MTVLGWIILSVVLLAAGWAALFWWFERDRYLNDEGRFLDKVPPLDTPPFEGFRWTRSGEWEGQARCSAWAGFCSAEGSFGGSMDTTPSDGSFTVYVPPHSPKQDRIPSEAQARAYRFQMEHAPQTVNTILNALPSHYTKQRQDYMLSPREMPDVTNPEDFRRLIGLHAMTIHPFLKDGMSYVGLFFVCEWDTEHGLGVMMHGSQIIEMGDHDSASLDCRPCEAQDP